MVNDNSDWAIFGKIAAGLVGVGAVGAGLYFGINGIYNEGYNRATLEASSAQRQALQDQEQKLKAEGRLLDGCLRYATSTEKDQTTQRVYVNSSLDNCSQVPHAELKFSANNKIIIVDAINNDIRVRFDPRRGKEYDYETRLYKSAVLTVEKLVANSDWVPYTQ